MHNFFFISPFKSYIAAFISLDTPYFDKVKYSKLEKGNNNNTKLQMEHVYIYLSTVRPLAVQSKQRAAQQKEALEKSIVILIP